MQNIVTIKEVILTRENIYRMENSSIIFEGKGIIISLSMYLEAFGHL